MRNAKQREALDDEFELAESYDFSDGVRGRFYQPKKVPTTIRLDNDVILYLKNKQKRKKLLIKL